MSSEPTTESAGRKPISPAKRRQLQQCFEYGRANLAKGDIDYAIDMFTQAVQGDPGNLVYAQNYVDTLHKKYNNDKKGGKLGFRGSSLRSTIKKSLAKEDYDAAWRACLEILRITPWDTATLVSMAGICEKLDAWECQLYYLKQALDSNPKDADVNRLAGHALAKVGAFEQSIVCWHRVEKAKPDDEEATKMIAQLTAERALQRGGGGGTRSPRPSASNAAGGSTAKSTASAEKPTQPADDDSDREQTIEERTQQAIEADPSNVANYLELAEIYARAHKYDQAQATLEKAQEVTGGGDLKVRERMEDHQIRHKKHLLSIADRRAAEEKTDEAQALAKKMKAELNRTEMQVYSARVQRQPGNDTLHYELGVRLKRASRFKEAIGELQQAVNDIRHKARVHLELGECFQYVKQFKLALSNYQQAIKASAEKEPDTHKLALYRAGVLAIGMYKLDQSAPHLQAAEDYLTELGGLDFSYRDVAERLDKINQLRNKG